MAARNMWGGVRRLVGFVAAVGLAACSSLLGVNWDGARVASSDGGPSDDVSSASGSGGDSASIEAGDAASADTGTGGGPEAGEGGGCTPGAMRCNGLTPQTCDSSGEWQSMGAGCPVLCNSGSCSACTAGTIQCNGLQPQTCGSSGAWQNSGLPCPYVCSGGGCSGMCVPGSTNPVACGNCGTDTQTCTTAGTWQGSGTCSGQGTCAPNAIQSCDTYGSYECSAACTWGACSCPSTPVCAPGATQCSGASVQTCDACGQWGAATACATGRTCSGGSCVPTGSDAGTTCSSAGNATCDAKVQAQCYPCCQTDCASGFQTLVDALAACLCGTSGPCTSACAGTGNFCASPGNVNTTPCDTCVNQYTASGATCDQNGAAIASACAGNPQCPLYQSCANGCP
jgi:hypothetical protein